MGPKLERTISVVLTTSAAVIAIALAHRELTSTNAPSERSATPELIADWRTALDAGILLGSEKAPVKLVEFVDFECPACRAYQKALSAAKRRYGDSISLTVVHFPLTGHRFAIDAAKAADCADEQGRFGAYSELLFDKQDSLGLKTWAEYARDAQVVDSTAFKACISRPENRSRVTRGRALGKKFGVNGTPTILVNGWRFHSPPSDSELSVWIGTALKKTSTSSVARR